MTMTRGKSAPQLVLVDTNVWLSYFLGAEPGCEEALRMIETCLASGVGLLYAPTAPKDVFYIVQRELRRRERDEPDVGIRHEATSMASVAWACVDRMSELATAAPMGVAECELARMFRSRHEDLEDNLVMAVAETSCARFVATFDQQLIRRFSPACARPRDVARAVSPAGDAR